MICAVAFGVFAQSIDLDKVDPSMINFNKVDLSKVKFYFQGPMELLVTNVVYEGVSYTATLDYDGMGNMTVKVPRSTSTAGLPSTLDLSKITLKIGADSLVVENVVADGATFSGKLVPVTVTKAKVADPKITALPGKPAADPKMAYLQRENVKYEVAVKNLEAQLKEAQKKAAEKDAEIAKLKAQPAPQPTVVVQTASEIKGTRVVVGDNVAKASVAGGTWRVSGSKLIQSDASQLYAKYMVPVPQRANSQEYSFKVASTSKGRVGAGLHILASDVKNADKYGFGSSYLIWITRDPGLQTDSTFIQVYKSSSDIRMAQVASKAIKADISKMNAIRVIADRNNDMLYVYVNGVLEISMPAQDLWGNTVALRTMGAAEFSY